VIRRTADPVALTVSHFMSGVSLLYRGELVAAQAALDTALGFYNPGEHFEHILASGMDNGVHVLNHLALTQWMLGFPDTSLQTAHQALDRARQLGHSLSTGLALHFACHVHELRREWGSVGRLARQLTTLGGQHNVPHFRAWGMVQMGAALIGRGNSAAGITEMSRGLAELRGAGDEVWRPFYDALLACALKEAGRTEEVLAVLEGAATLIGEGQRVHEAEVKRATGWLLLSISDRGAEGEARLLQAIEVARVQGAKSWELRAAISLAQVWTERSKLCQARDLLAPIYSWFTEGFNTPDLKQAKALLDALS
jgi:adenylate cyclase